MRLLLLLLAAASPASALPLPDWGRRPFLLDPEYEQEGVSPGLHATCATLGYDAEMTVPSLTPPGLQAGLRSRLAADTRRERKRLLLGRRAFDSILDATTVVVGATNECAVWGAFEVFASSYFTAHDLEAAASLDSFRPSGVTPAVVKVARDSLSKDLASVEPASGPYPDACSAPPGDPPVFVPAADGPLAGAGADMAEIAEVGRAVAGAHAAQRAAFAGLLRALNGRGCRELLAAFDALRAAQLGAYTRYRGDALRDATRKRTLWERLP